MLIAVLLVGCGSNKKATQKYISPKTIIITNTSTSQHLKIMLR